jgi:flavin reductase (DIM6/NTAB) family NADH-FMN oxidoreductase RutF
MIAPDPISAAIANLPQGMFVITSSYDSVRTGVIVRGVMPCATEPRLICVAVTKGHTVEPLIRDSRHFGLCQIDPSDKLAVRKFEFAADHDPEKPQDPFNAMPVETLQSGSPILKKSPLAFDCEVVRHFDLEADCELYVGLVLAVRGGRHV